jgi:hypothetical protein
MRYFLGLILVFFTTISLAQYSLVSIKQEQAIKLGIKSKTAVLNIVINNEKDPFDAALLSAIKAYWKIGEYKLISVAEFIKQRTDGTLSTESFYLYESKDDFLWNTDNNNLVLIDNWSKIRTGKFNFSGAVPLNQKALKKNKNTKPIDEVIYLTFDMSSTYSTNKETVIDGFYDLMIKYFNYEISFCQKESEVKSTTQTEKEGYTYFKNGVTEIQTKNILLTKEQVNKSTPSKKSAKKVMPLNAVSQFNPNQKNIYTVFPEDIKLALSKNDKDVLLYCNDMLIKAETGEVIVAPSTSFGGEYYEKRDHFFPLVLGIVASAFLIAYLLK